LESAKVRLELQIENMRKDYKRELTSKDDEVEDVRCSSQKKVKGKTKQTQHSIDPIAANFKVSFGRINNFFKEKKILQPKKKQLKDIRGSLVYPDR